MGCGLNGGGESGTAAAAVLIRLVPIPSAVAFSSQSSESVSGCVIRRDGVDGMLSFSPELVRKWSSSLSVSSYSSWLLEAAAPTAAAGSASRWLLLLAGRRWLCASRRCREPTLRPVVMTSSPMDESDDDDGCDDISTHDSNAREDGVEVSFFFAPTARNRTGAGQRRSPC